MIPTMQNILGPDRYDMPVLDLGGRTIESDNAIKNIITINIKLRKSQGSRSSSRIMDDCNPKKTTL